MKINVILPCGGAGSRARLGYNKLMYDVGGMPLIAKTAFCFARKDVSRIVFAVNERDLEWFGEFCAQSHLPAVVVLGGKTRTESVFNALAQLEEDCDYVMIHDGARPFVTQAVIDAAIATAIKCGNAVACVPATDSLRKLCEGGGSIPLDRSRVVCIQTPQIFKPDELCAAYRHAMTHERVFTDDASVYEAYIGSVHLSQGDSANVKVTYTEDFSRFSPPAFRVGTGWDTHALAQNRKLILGGVEIPHDKGLLGHSDADVLAHAVMDALLTAAHLGDIGALFPDNDERYRNADSMRLMEEVRALVSQQGLCVSNVSATVMAQRPKLKEYIPAMQQKIADTLHVDPSRVSIAATTTEKLGFVGREEGISAQAYCALCQA